MEEEAKAQVLKGVTALVTGWASEEEFILNKDKVNQRNNDFLHATTMDLLTELLTETEKLVDDDNTSYNDAIRTLQGFGIIVRDYLKFHQKRQLKALEALRSSLKYHNSKPTKARFSDPREYSKAYNKWKTRFESIKKENLKQTQWIEDTE